MAMIWGSVKRFFGMTDSFGLRQLSL